jgi:hypothetical protein
LKTYRQLDEAQILVTLTRLRDRITERFPDSGLARVAGELLALGRETAALVAYLRRPLWPVRCAVGLVIVLLALVLFGVVASVRLPTGVDGLAVFAQATEAAINDLIFLGATVYFLVTLENRLKRRKALAALHQLRSVAHVVDMHQLMKDPEQLASSQPKTPSSPIRALTASQLGRYLDYCSELLSVVSKITALHVQHFNDPVTLSAVNEIETLTIGLSGKIWQKISLLDRFAAATRHAPAAVSSGDLAAGQRPGGGRRDA